MATPHDSPFQLDLSRQGSQVTCRVTGHLVGQRGDALYRALAPHLKRRRSVTLSLGGVLAADAVAAASLAALWDQADAESAGRASAAAPAGTVDNLGASSHLHIVDISPAIAAQLDHVPAHQAPARPRDDSLLVLIAERAQRLWRLFVSALVFQADAFFGCAAGLYSSKNRRRGQVWRDALSLGADAVPVVATIAFLLGLILAFQGGHLMRDFGTSIYVANLVAKGMVREFAPLMTAIVVAGRSGAAIAAEIGSMKVSEELDALTVTGIEPTRYLVVPKLYAVTFTQPMLSVIASFVAILGGFLIAVTYLQLSAEQYIHQSINALSMNDLANCLLKSVIFGWAVVLIGAFQGFGVERGAEGVGRAATRAVVVAIFAIIFIDGVITTVDTLL